MATSPTIDDVLEKTVVQSRRQPDACVVTKRCVRRPVDAVMCVVVVAWAAIAAGGGYLVYSAVNNAAIASMQPSTRAEAVAVAGRLRSAFVEPLRETMSIGATLGTMRDLRNYSDGTRTTFRALGTLTLQSQRVGNIAWASVVKSAERPAWEARMSALANATVFIRNFSQLSAPVSPRPPQDWYLPIVDLANPAPIASGADVLSDATRSAAAQEAMFMRRVVLSKPTTNVVSLRSTYIGVVPVLSSNLTQQLLEPFAASPASLVTPPRCGLNETLQTCVEFDINGARGITPLGVLLYPMDFSSVVPDAIAAQFSGRAISVMDIDATSSPACTALLPTQRGVAFGVACPVLLAGSTVYDDSVEDVRIADATCASGTRVFTAIVDRSTADPQLVVQSGPASVASGEVEHSLVFAIAGRWIKVTCYYGSNTSALPTAALAGAMLITCMLILGVFIVALLAIQRQHKLRTEVARQQAASSAAERGFELAIAHAAHELRNPLHVITATLSLLDDVVESAIDSHACGVAIRALRTVHTNFAMLRSRAEIMHRLVSDFTAYRYLDHAVELLHPVAQDPVPITEQVLRMHTPLFNHAVRLRLHVRTGMPQVILDSLRWQQVLSNGLTNAAKFCDFGSVEVLLSWLEASDTSPSLMVCVVLDDGKQETGSTAPAFSVADATASPFSIGAKLRGSGLGLNIASRMVQAAGGSLKLVDRKLVDPAADHGAALVIVQPVLGKPSALLSGDAANSAATAAIAAWRVGGADFYMQLDVAGSEIDDNVARPSEVCVGVSACLETVSPRLSPVQVATPVSSHRHQSADNSSAAMIDVTAGSHSDIAYDIVHALPQVLHAGSPPISSMRVLYVDDDNVNASLMRRMLRRHGWRCDTVSDGDLVAQALVNSGTVTVADAVAALFPSKEPLVPRDQTGPPLPFDVILLDMVMQRVDGITACQALRRLTSLPADFPIIAVTANDTHASKEDPGFSAILRKPCTDSDVIEAVWRLKGFAAMAAPPAAADARAAGTDLTVPVSSGSTSSASSRSLRLPVTPTDQSHGAVTPSHDDSTPRFTAASWRVPAGASSLV